MKNVLIILGALILLPFAIVFSLYMWRKAKAGKTANGMHPQNTNAPKSLVASPANTVAPQQTGNSAAEDINAAANLFGGAGKFIDSVRTSDNNPPAPTPPADSESDYQPDWSEPAPEYNN